MVEIFFAIKWFLRYNIFMHNWSTDVSRFKNQEEKTIWQLEQTVNFGLDEGENISKQDLIKYWKFLNLDPAKRNFLEMLLLKYGNFN